MIIYGITIEKVVFKGIVLFPDNFTDQEGWKSKCSTWTWEDFNDLGLVFLPAAGARHGDIVAEGIGRFGYYWSSSPYPKEMAENYAWRLSFGSEAHPGSQSDRDIGHCIRLVADVTE